MNEKLQKLKAALEAGVLTQEEYEKKARELCGLDGEEENLEDDGVVYFGANGKADSVSQEVPKNPKANAGIEPKKKGKIFIIIGAAVLVLLLIIGIASCGGDDKETQEWPEDNKMAQMLPTPDGDITSLYIDEEKGNENLDATVEISGSDDCKDYIDACKEKGFTKVENFSQYDGDYDFTAKNEKGWQVKVYNFDEEMDISLKSPGYLKSIEEASEDSEEEEVTEEEEPAEDTSSDFRETMDAYEDFVDEYIAFMEEYNESDNTAAMLTDYSKMMSKYADFAKKIEDIDEDSLSDADYQYYIEVTTRVNEKLLNANIS